MAVRPITFQPFPTASARDTRDFLTRHTLSDDELMRELWNTFSGLPGLLSARTMDVVPKPLRRGERDYIYNPHTGKYRRVETDKTVSESVLRRAVYKVTTEVKNRMREETKQMMAGTILFVIWYQRMRSLLKAMMRAIFTVTLGGALFEDEGARNLFYLWSIFMFERFDQFKIAIESGAMEWNGHIRSAAGRLARSGNGAYQNAKIEIGRRKGHDEAMRILGENENHCHDSEKKPGCVELAELGWVPINKIVPIGDATCGGYCLCEIRTRKRPNA